MATNYKSSNADLETKFNPLGSTVTAKTYGSPSMTITGEEGTNVLVPEITLDEHGHISVVERTITIKTGWYYTCTADCSYDWGCCDGEGDDNGE